MTCSHCGCNVRVAVALKKEKIEYYCVVCLKEGGLSLLTTLHGALLSRALSLLQR